LPRRRDTGRLSPRDGQWYAAHGSLDRAAITVASLSLIERSRQNSAAPKGFARSDCREKHYEPSRSGEWVFHARCPPGRALVHPAASNIMTAGQPCPCRQSRRHKGSSCRTAGDACVTELRWAVRNVPCIQPPAQGRERRAINNWHCCPTMESVRNQANVQDMDAAAVSQHAKTELASVHPSLEGTLARF